MTENFSNVEKWDFFRVDMGHFIKGNDRGILEISYPRTYKADLHG